MKKLDIVPMALLWALFKTASACPDGQYEVCTFFCYCVPNSGEVGKVVTRPIEEANAEVLGRALEQWINQSRNSAIGTSQPVPPQIRSALSGYISGDIIDRARFKVGDNGILNLTGLSIKFGDPQAVTVNDLIVFRTSSDALGNPGLWAHELTHVAQYRDWGVHSFAVQYVRNYNQVESPAYASGNGFEQWKASQPPMQSDTSSWPGPVTGQGLPSGTQMQPCGCWPAPMSYVAPEPRCQSGAVQATMCNGLCPPSGTPFGWVCR